MHTISLPKRRTATKHWIVRIQWLDPSGVRLALPAIEERANWHCGSLDEPVFWLRARSTFRSEFSDVLCTEAALPDGLDPSLEIYRIVLP